MSTLSALKKDLFVNAWPSPKFGYWNKRTHDGAPYKNKRSCSKSQELDPIFLFKTARNKDLVQKHDKTLCVKTPPKTLLQLTLVATKISKRRITNSMDTRRELKVHKTFKRGPGWLLIISCTFNSPPVSKGNTNS